MPEGFEFADELAFASVGVVNAAGEVVRAEVAVGGGLGEYMPDDHDQGVRGGDSGFWATFFAESAVTLRGRNVNRKDLTMRARAIPAYRPWR